MRYMKWIGLAAAILLVVSCCTPWVFIESRNIIVSGIDAAGTNFGKPGYFHFAMAAFFLFFHLMPRVWAKRANLLVVALNLGWAIRNFFVIAACQGGECPVKRMGLYLVLLSSIIMLLAALFPDMKMPGEKKQDPMVV
jgi:hypothetical protein